MTIPEFLDALRTIEARWRLDGGLDIRCEAGDCPITRVAAVVMQEAFHVEAWEEAAAALDLDYDDARAIVSAADGDVLADYDSGLRAALLAATVERPDTTTR